MLKLEYLLSQSEKYKAEYNSADPFPHIVVDNVCDEDILRDAIASIPDPAISAENKSNDFIFAKNKFENPKFEKISNHFETLRGDLMSESFSNFLSEISGDSIFVDPSFHGGGLHQGGSGSFLTMHADFNFHPENLKWFRNLNILIYLNEDWKSEYGGCLKLKNGSIDEAAVYEIEPRFNRMVIMQTREHTIHGYDKINFPTGKYRRSIAAYGYTVMDVPGEGRTTVWYSDSKNVVTRMIGKKMPTLVKLKRRILGSKTSRNTN